MFDDNVPERNEGVSRWLEKTRKRGERRRALMTTTTMRDVMQRGLPPAKLDTGWRG